MSDKIVGTQIGIYNVLRVSGHRAKDGHKLYRVKCRFCGREFDFRKIDISRAKQCTHLDATGGERRYSYIWENQKIKKIFSGMKQRCYNPTDKSYCWYGEKGIKIYSDWLNNPKSFENWALENGYKDNLTIDRIDENKDYCPENCRWVSFEDNSRYKSTTRILTVNNKSKTGRDWAKTLGLGINTINNYVRKYRKENTENFISKFLENPSLASLRRNGQSFYDIYMKS